MESATIKQYISVCLLLVCMVSATMTGTLAWHDYSQHKSNEFWGMGLTQEERGQAVLEKLDKETNEPLQGAVFELYKVAAEGDDTLVGSFTTGEDGKIRVEGLTEGSYYWLETDPSFGYTYDKDIEGLDIKKYPFELAVGEDGAITPVTVRAYNERQKADLTITKRVEQAATPDGEQGEGAGGNTGGAGSGEGDGQGTGSGTETPAGPATPATPAAPGEGQGGAEQGADQGSAEQGGSNQGTGEEATAPATDSGQAGGEEAATPGEAGEEGRGTAAEPAEGQESGAEAGGSAGTGEGQAGSGASQGASSGGQGIDPLQADGPLSTIFRFTVTFTGLEDGPVTVLIDEEEQQMEVEDGKLVIELKHGQSATIKDLPVGTGYLVEEEPVDGYVVWSENEEGTIPPEGITARFVNYYAGEEPGKLIVEKIVTGDDADPDKEFGFTVTINGEETKFKLKAGETKEFELPPNAVYSVVEDDYSRDGFAASFATEYYTDEDGVSIVHVKCTNDYTGPVQIEIEGEKTWDLSGVNVVLPGSIIVYLKDGTTTVDTVAVTPDANGEWHYRFTAPKYRADGTEIVYTIEEVAIPGFYTTYNGYNVKNTYVPPESVVIPPVKKIVSGSPKDAVTFHFRLTGLANAPMPEGSSNGQKHISVTGAGEGDFGQIKYNRVGTYHYTISEINGDMAGWTYDKTIYNLTVTVTQDNGRLVAEKAMTKADGSLAAGKAEFTNKYEKPPAPPKPPAEPTKPPVQPNGPFSPKTGDESDIWLWAIMMVVSAVALRALLLRRRPGRE